jgi:excisionase family DNA binding protein
MEITFEQLPKAVGLLCEDMAFVKQRLLEIPTGANSESDQLLTVQQAAEFLILSVPTIYGLISSGTIPCMKRSKRVYFLKIELINYLKQGRKNRISEDNQVTND